MGLDVCFDLNIVLSLCSPTLSTTHNIIVWALAWVGTGLRWISWISFYPRSIFTFGKQNLLSCIFYQTFVQNFIISIFSINFHANGRWGSPRGTVISNCIHQNKIRIKLLCLISLNLNIQPPASCSMLLSADL